MIFEQHYLDCLSQASYLIGDESTGRAVVVDPRRDIGEYLASAEEHGLSIELVLETHFHADFLSGHLELAEATGDATMRERAIQTANYVSYYLQPDNRIVVGFDYKQWWYSCHVGVAEVSTGEINEDCHLRWHARCERFLLPQLPVHHRSGPDDP